MKKSLKISIVVVLAIISMYSCSKNSDNESKPIETDEYYSDSSGKYVMQLGDNGYNVFKDGSPVESAGISNRGTSTLAGYQYRYDGLCFAPPARPRGPGMIALQSLPVQPAAPSKKTITNNLKTIGGGYRVTPKPPFLGGTNYECYECIVNQIERDKYFMGVCNGSIFIGGSVSEEPEFQNLRQTLSGIAFNPDQTGQFIQAITSTGAYTCTKR